MVEDKKREYVHIYGCVTLLYSRNWHDIVNQPYFNKKFKKRIRLVIKIMELERVHLNNEGEHVDTILAHQTHPQKLTGSFHAAF